MKIFFLLVGLSFFALDALAYNPTIAVESEPVQEQPAQPEVKSGAEKPAAAKREIARKKKRKHRKHRRNRRHRR